MSGCCGTVAAAGGVAVEEGLMLHLLSGLTEVEEFLAGDCSRVAQSNLSAPPLHRGSKAVTAAADTLVGEGRL